MEQKKRTLRAAGLPFKSLSKIMRARREMRDLLGEIEQHRGGELNERARRRFAASRCNARDGK
jgi:hypothetical protein